MKRYYCDLCNEEMAYDAKPVRNTNGATQTVLLNSRDKGQLEITLTIEIKARRLIPRTPEVGNFTHARRQGFGGLGSEPLELSREHADLCAGCRWGLLEQLRGTHTLSDDTTFGAIGGLKLDWSTEKEPIDEHADRFPDD